jgi:hypothetical protein
MTLAQGHEAAEIAYSECISKYQAMVRIAVDYFNQGQKEECKRFLRAAEHLRRDGYREFSMTMKKLYRRAWPPPKKELHKTSFKGKKNRSHE